VNAKRRKDNDTGEEENPFIEYHAQIKSVGAVGGEIGHEQAGYVRHRVRVVSRRVRLCDPDNLVGGVKHLLDALRLAEVIPEDNPNAISLEVSQEKVSSYGKEETWVEVTV
jgi:hypothetical protein